MSSSAFRKALAVVGAVALVGLAACSSDASVQGATTSVTPGGDVSTTVVVPATDGATTTAAPTPTDAATTTAAPAPGPAGWATVDPSTLQGPLAFPCCASNWFSLTPSPALPGAGGTLADGVYRIEFQWPGDFSQPVTATITRFELCSNLPADACEDVGGFTADDLGVDKASAATIELTIDGSVRVVLGGFNGSSADDNFAVGNGAELAELINALDADYQTAVLDPAAAGTDFDTIVANLVAAPAYGFAAPPEEFAGSLSYTHNGAPPLLFQGLPGVGDGNADARGTDIVGQIALVVSGGTFTLNLYAGFYS